MMVKDFAVKDKKPMCVKNRIEATRNHCVKNAGFKYGIPNTLLRGHRGNYVSAYEKQKAGI